MSEETNESGYKWTQPTSDEWLESDDIQYKLGETKWSFQWKGKYTRGYSWVRGTHVILTEDAGIRYNESSNRCEFNDEWAQDSDIGAESPTKILSGEYFEIIDHIKLIKLWKEANERDPLPQLPKLDPNHDYIIQSGAGEFIWYVMYDFDKTIAELSMVEELGIKNGVHFQWV